MRVRFGDCVLDTGTRELFRGEEAVHLQPKVFRLLELLVENRPRALSKDELHEKVWPGTFVSEATLASAISDIRAAIGKGGRDSSYIRTVHGYGYSFAGEARPTSGGPPSISAEGDWVYRLVWETREISLEEGENILGRDREVVVWIDDASVSRRHARILISRDGATLEDLQSKNGTFLRGERVGSPVRLADGDEIRLGSVPMTLRVIPIIGSTATQGRT
jgi:DNA-binding winged helix-turn-helix (wHTH) protein